ncbi:MAG: recombination mediator RecR [Vampirovibrionales bacterium]|nr:recombination mediator RecR [Vampirovibrionales bacterium]
MTMLANTTVIPQALAALIEAFQKLPGVGPKSAMRLALHTLKQPEAYSHLLADALVQAKRVIQPCGVCGCLADAQPCALCRDDARQNSIICIVPESSDVFALERAGHFKGRYHVLGGLISPLDGIGPESLSIEALLGRLKHAPDVQELILALAPSVEGDTTSLYLSRLLEPLPIKLSRIAFGLPVGGELEYADSLTLARALEGRRQVGF